PWPSTRVHISARSRCSGAARLAPGLPRHVCLRTTWCASWRTWPGPDSKLPRAADQSLPKPALLTLVLEGIFGAIFSNHAEALLEAQDWAWNTVFWGFCFALVLGVGSVRICGGGR